MKKQGNYIPNSNDHSMTIPNDEQINDLLNRGVYAIHDTEELINLLKSGRQLHLKLGVDVTGPLIHLGHAVVQRKIRDFQELGHRLTLIIGDFTTIVGDHSDKTDMREDRTMEAIESDLQTYMEQFFRTVIPEMTTIRRNSEWLKPLNFNDVINLAKKFTVAQMIERENFKLRYEQGKPIRLSEFLYPLMQGYDSIALNNDIEFGGTDQLFNILAGRHLMSEFGMKPQIAFTVKLLTGSDGRKMGKSLKNYIAVMATPDEMYFSLMSVVDELITQYMEYVTRIPLWQIKEYEERMRMGENPMIFKKIMAYEIVKFYHGEDLARKAAENFERLVQNKDYKDIEDVVFIRKGDNIVDVVTVIAKCSRSEARRLISQSAVEIDGNVIKDTNFNVESGLIIKVGKKFINRINFV